MSRKYNVVFTGLQEGVTEDEFVSRFCEKFGISEEKARKISVSDSEITIKKDLVEDKAQKYLAALEACGMIARMDEIVMEPEDSGLSLTPLDETQEVNPVEKSPEPATGASTAVCPKCGSGQIDGDECLACGIVISKYLASQESSAIVNAVEAGDEQAPATATADSNNPYAPPEAELDRSFVSKDGQGSLEGAISGEYDFTIGDIFREGWDRVSGSKGTFLLAWVFYILVTIAVNVVFSLVAPNPELLMQQGNVGAGVFWSLFPGLISIPILYPILAGIVLLGIHRSVDADISASSVFNHYNKVIPITLVSLLTGILTIIGFMLLILPGIYLAIAYMMAMALIIDKDMGVWEAMEASRKAISKQWFKIFVIYLLLWLLIMAASIPLLIGLIWALPLAAIMHGVMYKYMFGVDSVD